MASGIYRLTFSSGTFYIGKSLDLETRWKQHFNKFATGKAARPMQIEYDRCGLPQTEVMYYCHQDHIDIMEEWLIDEYKCGDMLNTTYPKVQRIDEIAELINANNHLMQLCTWDHLKLIANSQTRISQAQQAQDEAEQALEEYKSNGYIINQDYLDVVKLANEFKSRMLTRKDELVRLSKLSWWDRLFNYKVYV
jgi:hypothetical protein